MSETALRRGYENQNPMTNAQDEYGSAMKDVSLDPMVLGQDLLDIQAQRALQASYLDNSKPSPKKAFIPPEYAVFINPSQREKLNEFLQNLSDNVPYKILLKNKVPILNKAPAKVPEIIYKLANYEIPTCHAIWYIKVSSYFTLNQLQQSQNEPHPGSLTLDALKNKKKAPIPADGANEWTSIINSSVNEISAKLLDQRTPEKSLLDGGKLGFDLKNGQNYQDFIPSSHHEAYDPSIQPTIIGKEYYRMYWDYIVELAIAMYGDKLLDRDALFQNLVTRFDLSYDEKNNFDGVKLFLPFILGLIEGITKSHFMSRKLAWCSSRYLSLLYSEDLAAKNPYLNQDPLVVGLSSIIQSITLACPSALVWYPEYRGIAARSLAPHMIYGGGSPLDICPLPPSKLPYQALNFEPEHYTSSNSVEQVVREKIAENERLIIKRSEAVEGHWSCDKWKSDPLITETLNRVLKFLNFMDFEAMKTTSLQSGAVFTDFKNAYKCPPNKTTLIVDELYFKIFDESSLKKDESPFKSLAVQDAIVSSLCQWAITTERKGMWRPTLVAKIIERRLDYLEADENIDSNSSQIQSHFQVSILKFLDQAPILTDPKNLEELIQFQHLMLLMGELIRHEVFNYSSYLNYMLCNEDFMNFSLVCDIQPFGESKPFQTDLNMMNDDETKTVDSPSNDEYIWGYNKPRHVQYVTHMPLFWSSSFEWLDDLGQNKNGK